MSPEIEDGIGSDRDGFLLRNGKIRSKECVTCQVEVGLDGVHVVADSETGRHRRSTDATECSCGVQLTSVVKRGAVVQRGIVVERAVVVYGSRVSDRSVVVERSVVAEVSSRVVDGELSAVSYVDETVVHEIGLSVMELCDTVDDERTVVCEKSVKGQTSSSINGERGPGCDGECLARPDREVDRCGLSVKNHVVSVVGIGFDGK